MSDDAPHLQTPSHDTAERLSRRIDTSRPHPARVYDVFLGGKDHYPADAEAARAGLALNPRGYLDIRHNRAFLRRAVAHLAKEAGLRQFLDIGTGLPTQENVHQIAQRIAPEARIVYVDNDPVVLTHARVLLAGDPAGRTDYIEADLRDPATILREAARTLDFDRPVGLVMAAILHFVEDEVAYDVVAELLAALPSGSHLVLSHLTADLNPEGITRMGKSMRERGLTFVFRPAAKVVEFHTANGMELIEPGLVPVHQWRPDHSADTERRIAAGGGIDAAALARMDDLDRTRYRDIHDVTDADISIYGSVSRKP